MEAKKFISTLKGIKTRYTNKPNADAEKKAVENLIEKVGGKLEAIATLKEAGMDELKSYLKGIIGHKDVVAENKTAELPKTTSYTDGEGHEYARANGKIYELDTVKKTMKVIGRDLSQINFDDIDVAEMPMTVYQRYLKDNFPGEDAPIKKDKLHFRGYRIYCNKENGFVIEDTTKHYEIVETPFEGIPTPRELGDWFKKPIIEHTPEEIRKAIELGKELQEAKKHNDTEEEEEIDFESLRRKVLRTIKNIRSKTLDFDPLEFPNMIPFKRWRRKVNSLLTQWKNRDIRYAKFLKEVEKVTTEETFVVEEKRHRSKFKGTFMPDHTKVGMLVGDQLEVDGKWIDAVPFLLEYLLFYEHRAMAQIMKYAAGEITDMELIKNPLEQDWKVEYNKRLLENNVHNAQVLCMVYDAVGVVTPQDLLYEADLEVGDKILVSNGDGELHTKTVASVDRGIVLGKEVGLLKLDHWIKLPKKNEK